MKLWESEYQAKKMTAKEAVKRVRSGDRVYVGASSSFAYDLLDALLDRKDELEDVEIQCSNSIRYDRFFHEKREGHDPFRILSYFMGPGERASAKLGVPLTYTSFHLSQVDIFFQKIARPTVLFLEVSPPDQNGYVSFGPNGGGVNGLFLDQAREVILEVNQKTPYVLGPYATMPVSRADALIETDRDIAMLPEDEVDPVSQKISDLIVEQIPDGATIQLGLGTLSTAIGYGLKTKNDLGIFSEMFNQPMVRLIHIFRSQCPDKERLRDKLTVGEAEGRWPEVERSRTN